jgi:hypothetical protein
MQKFLVLALVLFSVQSFAQRNPQIRVCNVTGGKFWSLKISQPKNDIVGFCRFDRALMGSISMMDYIYKKTNTLAMKALLSTREQKVESCFDVYSRRILSVDTKGIERHLCLFADYTFVPEQTLIEGIDSPFNRQLHQALLP